MNASPNLITSARDVVERYASCSPFTADYGAFIDALLKDDAGFHMLLELVLKRLQKDYAGVSLRVPGRKDPWSDQLAAVQQPLPHVQMKEALQEHLGETKEKIWWMPFLELLQAYAKQASAGGTAGLRRFFMAGGDRADRLALTLVVALAGHELRDSLEEDNVPLLTQQAGGSVLLHVRAVKASGIAAGKARDQLALAARVLVFAVHAANAPLLASCGPLTVHGTAAFFEHGVKAKHLDGTTVDVGAPPQARASALPATVGTLTHISVEYRFPK